MLSHVTIFIPTRDSGRWIGVFLDEYRKLGIDPLYIVDNRTIDDTVEILKSKGARLHIFTPSADFVEAGMIAFACQKTPTPWSLRFDDDEFPSQNLLRSLKTLCSDEKIDAWWLPRREVSLVNGRFVYSRFPTSYGYFYEGDVFRKTMTPQLRLLRNSSLEFIEEVHTPGVKVPSASQTVEDSCFFIHCKNFMTTPSERLGKVRKYASHDPKKAWAIANEYLPEMFDPSLHDFSEEGLIEFDRLLQCLPKATVTDFMISDAEAALAHELITSKMFDILRFIEARHDLAHDRLRDVHEIISPISPIVKRSAELILTLARKGQSERVLKIGMKLYKIANFALRPFTGS